jgi:hypothetical protein
LKRGMRVGAGLISLNLRDHVGADRQILQA